MCICACVSMCIYIHHILSRSLSSYIHIICTQILWCYSLTLQTSMDVIKHCRFIVNCRRPKCQSKDSKQRETLRRENCFSHGICICIIIYTFINRRIQYIRSGLMHNACNNYDQQVRSFHDGEDIFTTIFHAKPPNQMFKTSISLLFEHMGIFMYVYIYTRIHIYTQYLYIYLYICAYIHMHTWYMYK